MRSLNSIGSIAKRPGDDKNAEGSGKKKEEKWG
jgi:hypothetical protein